MARSRHLVRLDDRRGNDRLRDVAMLTTVGLFLDLAGFLIIALDVYRDYARFKSHKYFVGATAAALQLERRRLERINQTAAKQDAKRKRGVVQNVKRDEQIKQLAALRREHELLGVALAWKSLRRHPIAGVTLPDKSDFAAMADAFRIAAEAEIRRPYARPPLVFGLFLVILGFMFQIVGSWPWGLFGNH